MKTKLLLVLCFAGCMAKAQIIYTVAGNGTDGSNGDGGQATAAEVAGGISGLLGVGLDVAGNLYIADGSNAVVRKVNASGIISTVGGNGTSGYSGDGGQATAAKLSSPYDVVFDAAGNMYISDEGNSNIRKVTTAGIISTYAGNGTAGFSGDGGQATAAKLNYPSGMVVDANGNLYFIDLDNDRIRKVTTAGIISTIAGNGTYGFSGDGGQATAAELEIYGSFGWVGKMAFDASGNLYFADDGNNRVRKISTSGIISTFAGNGTASFSGDGGQATAAELNLPNGVGIDGAGNLYVGDYGNNRIRKVNPSGIISTIAGTGTAGFSGDGGQATAAKLNILDEIAVSPSGNIYIADWSNYRVREIVYAKCTANAGANVTDYDFGGTLCAAVTIGTSSIGGLTYAWAPTTALSCTNCAQPNSSYDNTESAQVYTLTTSGNYCITNTATVQVTTVEYTITENISAYTANPGSNITAVGNYTANFTPTYYYWSITQTYSNGTTLPGGYSWSNGWAPVEASGYNFTFPTTSTLTCNTYYVLWFAVGNSCAGIWATTTPTVIEIMPPTAGPNEINQESDCGSWPGVTIGSPSVSGVSYTWSPNTDLSSTTVAQPTSTYTTTSSPITYSLSASHSGCSTTTSTMQVSALTCGSNCGGGCRTAAIQALSNSTGIPVHMAVYPNPSNNNITIGLSATADFIRIIDMQGRTVYETRSTDAGELNLDISNYTKGMYFVLAKIGNAIEKQKLVVE